MLDANPPGLSTERTILGNQERREGSIEVQCGPNDFFGERVILKDGVQDFLLPFIVAVVGERLELLIQGRELVMRFVRMLPAFLVFGERKSVVIRGEERYAREMCKQMRRANPEMYGQWQGDAYLWQVLFKKST